MTRQSEALKLAEELLADIELNRIGTEQLLFKGMRLARLMSDDLMQEWLNYELRGYDPSSPLWTELMNLTGRWSDETKTTAHAVSLPRLQAMLSAEREKVAAMKSYNLSGDMILPAQNERFRQLNASTITISTVSAIIYGVLATLYEFVTRTYHELLFSEIQSDLFASVQDEIDSRIAPLTAKALDKIESVKERLKTGNTEAISHAMTTCRRLIDATADAIYPANDSLVKVDEHDLSVATDKTLNRLNAYAFERGATKGRRDRIRRSLADIYSRVCKGVHDDVTPAEARFIFIQTYLILGEIILL